MNWKMATSAAHAAAALLLFASCGEGTPKYKNRSDEVKNCYLLPKDAVVIKEMGVCSGGSNDIWCVFVLGGDTILYNYSANGQGTVTMCRVDGRVLEGTAAPDTTGQNKNRSDDK